MHSKRAARKEEASALFFPAMSNAVSARGSLNRGRSINKIKVYLILTARNEVALFVVPVELSPGVAFINDAAVEATLIFMVVVLAKTIKPDTGTETYPLVLPPMALHAASPAW